MTTFVQTGSVVVVVLVVVLLVVVVVLVPVVVVWVVVADVDVVGEVDVVEVVVGCGHFPFLDAPIECGFSEAFAPGERRHNRQRQNQWGT